MSIEIDKKNLSDREKLSAILQFLHLNIADLAKDLDVSAEELYNLNSARKVNFSQGLRTKIIKKYTQLNPVWLLTGEGDMLRVNNGEQKPLPIVEYAPSPKESVFEAQNTLLREQLREKEDVIAKLHSEIAVLNYKLNQEREKASSSLETTSAERL